MKTLFLSAAMALTLSAPASAQLLGGSGGSLTGGLSGQIGGTLGGTLSRPGGGMLDRPIGRPLERVPLDRLDAPVEQTTRAAKRARGSAEVERSVDRRNGRASAGGRADGGISGALDNQTGALGRSTGLSGRGNVSGSTSGGASADLIGTEDVHGTVGRVRDRAGSTVGTARGIAAGAVERGRGVADRASGAASNATNGLGGSASGSGSAAAGGSMTGDGASGYGSAEGAGTISPAIGNPAAALEPGARVEDARGRLIGKLQQVNRNVRGRIESLDILVGRKVATLPAGNFSASGDVLVSAMSKGEVKDAAAPE